MTFFLDPKPVERPASGLTGGLPTGSDAFGAMWTASNLQAGMRNFEDVKKRLAVQNERYDQIVDRIGDAGIIAGLAERGLAPAGATTFPREMFRQSPSVQKAVLDIARSQAEDNPDAWGDLDLSDEYVDAEANKRLREDYDEAQRIISMAPGSVARDLIAEFGASTLNIKTAPFLVAGLFTGGGSLLAVAGREAAINVAVEASLLPKQFEVAEILNIPDPSVRNQLLAAAAFGAAFGAGGEALGRGLSYIANRRALTRTLDQELLTQRLEEALSGPNPLERAQEIIDAERPRPPTPARGMDPLIPRQEDRVRALAEPDWDQMAARARESAVEGQVEPAPTETAPQAEGAPATISEAVVDEAEMQRADDTEREATGGYKYPLLQALSRAGIRFDPKSPEAGELRSMGITSRTMPRIFKRGGSEQGIDNLVASEWEERLPGIWDATNTPRDTSGPGGDYLDRDGVLELIRRDVAGDFSWMRGVQEAQSIRKGAVRTPERDFLEKVEPEVPGGMVINPELYEFEYGYYYRDAVRKDVEAYLDEHYPALDEAERAEVVHYAAEDGGPIDYLVERAYERVGMKLEEGPRDAELEPIDDAAAPPFGETAQPDGGTSVRSQAVADQAAGGGADQGRGGADAFPVQRDQFLVPGTDRQQTGVAQRQRAEIAARQQQGKMRRLDQERVEDDADGLFGGAQTDLFSDPTSPEARVVQDAEAGDDFIVDMGDGKGERSATAVLAELDADDEFADILDLCGRSE